MSKVKNPALQWAADRAGLPYERFVDGLTETTKQRILTAYHNRYVYDAPVRSVEDKETNIHSRIRDAFRRGKFVCPLMPSRNTYHLTWVSLTLDMGYLFTAAPESSAAGPYIGRGVSPHRRPS